VFNEQDIFGLYVPDTNTSCMAILNCKDYFPEYFLHLILGRLSMIQDKVAQRISLA